ncbi:MarC family protein [Deferribacterales bacterium RsTz2092]|nr:UPF0056 inner membrane protein [Deferribacterales bacterium]
MYDSVVQVIFIASAMIAITNPFGNLPMFIDMASDLTDGARRHLFRLIVYVGFAIVLVFALVGVPIMKHFFRLGVEELQVAGGILLLVLGIKNLLFPPGDADSANKPQRGEEAVHERIVPMAFPILVGPGTLSTVIILVDLHGFAKSFIGFFVAFVIIFIVFFLARYIERLLGKLVLFILSRIMQVFISAIGVSMIETGIRTIISR